MCQVMGDIHVLCQNFVFVFVLVHFCIRLAHILVNFFNVSMSDTSEHPSQEYWRRGIVNIIHFADFFSFLPFDVDICIYLIYKYIYNVVTSPDHQAHLDLANKLLVYFPCVVSYR